MDHKKTETGVDQVESGFLDKSPLDVLAAASAMPGVSSQEIKKQLGQVGIDVPEKPKKGKKEVPPEATGVGQVETGFLDKSPLDVLAAASAMPGVSPQEIKEQLGQVGIDVPEKPKKEKKEVPLGATGVGQVESGYLAQSPLDILAAASAMSGVSPREMKEQMAEAGIGMPDRPKREKKPHESHQSGVDSIEEGFMAEPEMSPVEELGAIKYAAAPREVEADIEKVRKKPDGRLTPSEALLAKLRESGYTGDLEALKKLAEEMN